jgi:hypothetical protein
MNLALDTQMQAALLWLPGAAIFPQCHKKSPDHAVRAQDKSTNLRYRRFTGALGLGLV